jgi:symplekin
MASTTDTLKSLNSARDILLKDHTLYPQVVPGIIQVIAPAAHLLLRRWGADFLAETFASQVVTREEKQQMSLVVLDTVKGYLGRKEIMGEDEDANVVKSAVQCAASIYEFVFRHTATTPADSDTWAKIASIKSSILRRMDTAPPGVRICCIKFVTCVVQTQTPGLIADPRKPEYEISLALVPRDHPVIPPANLEAEASGLLDRLLGVLQDNLTDPLIVTATLNALATLVQKRASVSSKILATVLQFNPLKLAGRPISGQEKIAIRSMTRTTMSFLLNCLKRNPNSTFAMRLQQQVERLKHHLTEVFSVQHLKRSAPDEPVDGLDDAKRQRLDNAAANGATQLQRPLPPQQQLQPPTYPPLPAGPISLAQLWTLTGDARANTFHAERLPSQAVTQLVPAIFHSLSQERLNDAINVVRTRWLNISQHSPASAIEVAKAVTGEEDDDDYDPIMSLGDETDQIVNRLDQAPPEGLEPEVAVGSFTIPAPPILTDLDRDEYSKTALTRVFSTLADLDKEAKTKGKQVNEHGFNRLAAANTAGHDREGWITLVTRLATRASFDLGEHAVKAEGETRVTSTKGQAAFNLSNGIREALFSYVMENFRGRIEVAIIWLNEEWYSDRLLLKQRQEAGTAEDGDLPNYWPWLFRLFDSIIPYLDVKDGRIIIRLLSEIPAVDTRVLDRVRKVAEDPERVQISCNALLYLVMFRPPVREEVLDCVERLWRENGDAKSAAGKILGRWRPGVLKEETAAKKEEAV